MARVLRSADGPRVKRERWELPDGDFVDVDAWPDPGPDAPIVLVLHGLEGTSLRSYVRSACRHLLAQGLRPYAMNLRGCSGEVNRRPRLYHSGETTDPGFVLQGLRAGFPGRRIGALGFSLGGNILLKLLGERPDGGAAAVDAAVAMSVPFDLAAGCALLEATLMGRLYTRYFLRSLRIKLRLRAAALAKLIDVQAGIKAPTIRAFDDAVTAPLHGFEDAADYYARCSSDQFLSGIRVPTLVLHAEDDPFLPSSAIPRAALSENPALRPRISPRGGHVGFLAGPPWAPRFYGEAEAAAFLAAELQ